MSRPSNSAFIMTGSVMHARLFPKKNAFRYGIYYLGLPLGQAAPEALKFNKPGMLSFHERDHGPRNGSPLWPWAQEILKSYGLERAGHSITLLTLPRILGYVFNPVSFWLCRDEQGNLRAVLCEVHNTFGEDHTYLCAHPDHRPIQAEDVMTAQKLFHVSPFLPREGHYTFKFAIEQDRAEIFIDYFAASGQKQLVTSLKGTFAPMTAESLKACFWKYPLITFKAIALIHYQALKLIAKHIPIIKKPKQNLQKISATQSITKN